VPPTPSSGRFHYSTQRSEVNFKSFCFHYTHVRVYSTSSSVENADMGESLLYTDTYAAHLRINLQALTSLATTSISLHIRRLCAFRFDWGRNLRKAAVWLMRVRLYDGKVTEHKPRDWSRQNSAKHTTNKFCLVASILYICWMHSAVFLCEWMNELIN
jgi:DNA uptake protein ComE-like DNA-binding protein